MFQLQEKYQITEKGRSGSMMRGVSKKDGKEVAIKKISFANMSDKDKKNVTEEVNLLRNIKSNNIVRYENYFVDKADANLYVVMEYCSGDSLEDYLQLNRQKGTLLQEKAIWKIFSQVVSAVNQIHNDPQGTILHRDIKPKNIMLDKNNTVKLTNFSLLRRLNPQQQFSMTFISGSYYRSPQQVTSGIYSTQSDIWALGCLLFEMATLRTPFKQTSDYLTAKSIQQDKVDNIPSQYSDQLKRVINWCLTKQRQNRPTATMLKGIPEINYRLRKARLTQYIRSYQQKQQKVARRQAQVKALEQKIKELQCGQYPNQDKQNYQLQNVLNENSLTYRY